MERVGWWVMYGGERSGRVPGVEKMGEEGGAHGIVDVSKYRVDG